MTPERFSEGGLRQALESDLELLNSSAGILMKASLPRDPTGEMLHLLDAAQMVAQPSSRGGVWFSFDGSRALLVAQTAAAASDVDAQEATLARVRNAFATAQQETDGSASAGLFMTGPVVFSVATRDRIKGDAARFSALATLMVASILLLVYRSARLSVHGITLGFGVTLIGEAVDYPICLFTQTAPGARPRETLPRIWPTLRLGVLTSVCGFGALLFSSFAGLAQLGAFSITGLIVAVSATRWVVPLLLPGNFETRRPIAIGLILRRVIQFAPRLRVPSLALVASAFLFLALQHNNLWDDELANLSPIPAADKDADQKLRTQLGAPDVRYLVFVSRPSEEETLEGSERVATELEHLIAAHALAGFQSPTAYLPSKAAQERRQEAIPPGPELTARLERALSTMPYRSDSFAPFLVEVAAAKTQHLIDRKNLADTSFEPVVDSLLVQRGRMWQALLPLQGTTDPGRVADAIARSGIPGAVFLDIKRDSDALYAAYRQQAVLLSLCGLIAILLFLSISLRRPRRVVAVVAPLAAAILVNSAVLILAGQRLSIFHLVGLLLVVAVGSNYSLFFEREKIAGEDYEWIIASLALANLCTVIGFGVLSLSYIPVLHGIGATVAIGTVLSLGFSAILARTRREAMS